MHCHSQQDCQPSTALTWLQSQPYAKSTLLKYNRESSAWQPAELSGAPKHRLTQITTLTLNVLTDCVMQAPLKRNLLFSSDRYAFILEYLGKVKPSVITLNEVTFNFYAMLTANKWAQDHYWISQFDHPQKDGSFNVIMTKIQPIFFRAIKLVNLDRPVLTLYLCLYDNLKQAIVSISCAHLTSRTQNSARRKQQLTELTNFLIACNQDRKVSISHVVQGDLNIHSEQQNTVFHELNWKDSWVVGHSKPNLYKQEEIIKQSPGFTFDGNKNSLIKEVYWGFEARAMRLDRIVYRGPIVCKNIQIVLNQPMFQEGRDIETYQRMGWLKGSVSFLADVVGVNMFRKKQEYLFPSDHFGLLCTLAIF